MSDSYYTLQERTTTQNITTAHYRCNIHCQGAWNEHEQHMAAATGVLAYELERFMPREDMRIGRISLDIFGLIHFGEFSITTQVIRGGRTIELLEATMTAGGKTCIVARACKPVTRRRSQGLKMSLLDTLKAILTGTVSNIGVVAISTVFILKPTPTTAKVGALSGLTMTLRW